LLHGRSLEHSILYRYLRIIIASSQWLTNVLSKFLAYNDFKINGVFPKRKYRVVYTVSVQTMYVSRFIRPNFSIPQHGGSVARHVMTLTTPLQISLCDRLNRGIKQQYKHFSQTTQFNIFRFMSTIQIPLKYLCR